MPELNEKTGLPHTLSLGRVLNDLHMTPTEINALLSQWSQYFRGTANDTAAQKLTDHAAMVVNTETYTPKAEPEPEPEPTPPPAPPAPSFFTDEPASGPVTHIGG